MWFDIYEIAQKHYLERKCFDKNSIEVWSHVAIRIGNDWGQAITLSNGDTIQRRMYALPGINEITDIETGHTFPSYVAIHWD